MKTLKKILKWTGISLLIVILIFAGVVASKQNQKFDAPYPEIHASTDSSVIAKGKYLFYGPAHCMDCHSNRADYPGIEKITEIPPSGGMLFDLPIGPIYTPNISSHPVTGIGSLTDAQVARTLRYGVGSDGRALLDFMPFHDMSDADLTAIISFVRTIPAVDKKVPRIEYNLLGKVISAFLIKPVGPTGVVPKDVKPEVSIAYGKYLTNSVANCIGCHTNRDMMTGDKIGEDFGGGLKLEAIGNLKKSYVARNLTPDKDYGHIKDWSEEQFVNRFHAGKLFEDSPMPWESFKQFSDSDLKAIYVYLQNLKPVHNDAGPVLVMEE